MNDHILGIGWATNQITIACLKKINKKEYRLLKLDRLNVSLDDPEDIGQSIRQWVEANLPKKSRPQVVLSIPESLTFIKKLELPLAKDKELVEAIRWELSSSKSSLPPDIIIQWKKIETKEKVVRLSAIIIKEEQASYFSSIIENAGLPLAAIEPTSFSFLRAAEINTDKVTLFINTEENETNLVIFDKGIPVFSTTASVSLLSTKKERRKLSGDVKSYLSSEAKKVLSYWEDKEKKKIQQIIITGSGIRFSGLAKAINQFAHIPTTLAKNKKNENVKTKSYSKTILNRFLIPLGAALRLVSEKPTEEINLLPVKERQTVEKEQKSFRFSQKLSLFSKVNLAILVLFLIFLGFLKFEHLSLIRQVNQTKIFVDNHPGQKYLPQVIEANNIFEQIEKLLTAQKDYSLKLGQISQLTPANLSFSSLKMTNLPKEQWEIQGTGARTEILAFYEKLKNSQVAEVTMPYSNLNKEKDNLFKIFFAW